jgi:hypothetical protein
MRLDYPSIILNCFVTSITTYPLITNWVLLLSESEQAPNLRRIWDVRRFFCVRRLSDASFYPGIPIGPAQLDSQVVKSNTKEQRAKSILPSDPPYVPTPCATAVAILIVVVEQTSKAARANYPAYLRAV